MQSASDDSHGEEPLREGATLKLIESSWRLINMSLDCEELGLHYRVTSPTNVYGKKSISTISRLDAESGEYIPYAQWERSIFKTDRFRFLVEARRRQLENADRRSLNADTSEAEEHHDAAGWVTAKELTTVTWSIWGQPAYL